jgi:hypothetical protein
MMPVIDAGHGVIRHQSVSESSNGAHPLGRIESGQTEIFLADVHLVQISPPVATRYLKILYLTSQ